MSFSIDAMNHDDHSAHLSIKIIKIYLSWWLLRGFWWQKGLFYMSKWYGLYSCNELIGVGSNIYSSWVVGHNLKGIHLCIDSCFFSLRKKMQRRASAAPKLTVLIHIRALVTRYIMPIVCLLTMISLMYF